MRDGKPVMTSTFSRMAGPRTQINGRYGGAHTIKFGILRQCIILDKHLPLLTQAPCWHVWESLQHEPRGHQLDVSITKELKPIVRGVNLAKIGTMKSLGVREDDLLNV